jgi:hypothetical protein
MTPKEKAMELVEQFPYSMKESKDYALIVVNEILNAHLYDLDEKQYWEQVKTEIENL